MFADRISRLKAFLLPAIVVLAVCAVVGWAAHSPVDWRTIDPAVAQRGAEPPNANVELPSEIRDTVASLDRSFEQAWQEAGVTPASPADDLQVLRRLSLALCGTIPSLEEIRTFESEAAPGRIDRWTVRLLKDNRYADYFAERLGRGFVGSEMGQFIVFRRDRFIDWLRQQLAQNAPYDAVVRQMIRETGLWTDRPATNYVTSAIADGVLDENKLAGRTVRAFLGQRIDCAQCHDHPFAEWKQTQFEGLASLFSQTQTSLVGVEDKTAMKYEIEDRKTLKKRVVEPAVPFHPEWLAATGTRRERLAAWVTHPDNRRFERATANRIWGLLFGKPYHAPVDDLPDPPSGSTNPAEHDVLDQLGADFREHQYDLRRMIRVIAASRPFRLDSVQVQSPSVSPKRTAGPSSTDEARSAWASVDSPASWSVFPLTRLRPEQLIGSILQAASLRTIDQNSHLFVRTLRYFQERDFVKEYGDLGENELDDRAGTISQALLRMNGKLASEASEAGPLNATGRIATFAGAPETCLETCYLVALTRRPIKIEADYFVPQISTADTSGQKGARAQTVEDLFWGLFNSPEFSWNH